MRLSLDIGTNSIGWWLYATDGKTITKVMDGGVRIFSMSDKGAGRDPKSGTSLAVDRREARSARRRRDRYLRRRTVLMKRLAAAGLMPADPGKAKKLELLDPYALRAAGLDQALPLTHLGRALFHLNQRRGFKSNRKTDRGDNESGKIKDATARLDQAMMAKGARTYGEFLHMRRTAAPDPNHTPSVRTRLSVANRDGSDKEEAGYDFYPDRRHLSEEFEKLWASQAKHHPDALTDELRETLYETIFYQRPLKAPQVGLCLFTAEERLPKAHPLTQRRVLYETVNNLKVAAPGEPARALTVEERDQIIHALDNKGHTKSLSGMSMKLKALGREIKLRPEQSFTLETANRDAIACDPVRASLSHPDRFGSGWSKLDADQQWDLVQRIRSVESDAQHADLVTWLMSNHDLDRSHADATANARLPEGYSRLGETATRRILKALESDVLTYSQAVAECGWHHSDHRSGETLDDQSTRPNGAKDHEWPLPYYGEILDRHVIPGSYDENDDDITRYGRITNPTVHIGLNQIRRLVNKIIDVHGKPDQIVVELARDLKQSEDQKKEINSRNKKNREAAEKRSENIEELNKHHSGPPIKDNGANRMRFRLWEDLGPDPLKRLCPYSGKPISPSMLFDGSCDVDHILPYSRTLDDGFTNRTLCLKEANRDKSDKTPWEAWGSTPRWDIIEANLKNLPSNKSWRFAPDAMERFEGEKGFLDRALKDTQYLSRIARSYLDALYTEGGHVWVVPGRLTEILRRRWRLNGVGSLTDNDAQTVKAKNRMDHRHHAIDAAVIGATDRSLIKRISDIAKVDEQAGAEDVVRSVPPPWDGFREDIDAQVRKIIVSHRADHGRIDPKARQLGHDSTTGQLHNDTAYGLAGDGKVVSRTALLNLKPGDIALTSKGKNIRDSFLQKALSVATKGKDGKAFEQALRDFAAKEGPYQGIRHVRLEETLQESARVEIKDKAGKPFKAYKGDSNHCYEIWQLPDGKIKSQVITTFEAHQPSFEKKPHPAAKRLMRVFKRDMVALRRDDHVIICHVQKFNQAGILFLAPHTESNADARDRNKDDTFSLMRMSPGPMIKAEIRRVFVNEIGHLRDPGPAY